MARLLFGGAETQDGTAEGIANVSGGAWDTTIFRSGQASYKIVSAGQYIRFDGMAGTGGTSFGRTYVLFTAWTTVASGYCPVITFGGNVEAGIGVNKTGVVSACYYDPAGLPAFCAGVGATRQLRLNTWYRFETKVVTDSGSNVTTIEAYIDGVLLSTNTPPITLNDGSTSQLFLGDQVGAGGTVAYFDDWACNDNNGAVQNSYPGEGKVVLLKPISDNARTGFTAGTAGTTNLWDAVNNMPPVGVARASSTITSQIQDNTSITTDSYTANLGAYTTAVASGGGGLAAIDVVRVVQGIAVHGNSSTTSRTDGLTVVSNPAIAEATAGTPTTAAGTHPTGWTLMRSAMSYSPAPTLGTSPTIKFRKGTASTDYSMASLMGLYVEYTATPALTALFCTGFEHGVSPPSNLGGGLGFSTITGSPTIVAAAARNGGFGFRSVTTTATTAGARMNAWTAPAKCVIRFAFRIAALPTVGNGEVQIFFFHTAGGSFISFYIDSGGLIYISPGGVPQWVAGGATITAGAWNVIELQIDASTNPMTTDWKVNGIFQARLVTVIAASTVDQVCLGVENSGVGISGFTGDYDDLILGSWNAAGTDWWGDGQVIAQLPGSDASHTTVADFSFGDAGTALSGTVTTAYTMVDDPPGTGGWTATRSTTDNLAMRVASSIARLITRPIPNAQPGVANAVRAIISFSSSTTAGNLAACDSVAGITTTAIWGTTAGTGANFSVTTNNFKGAILPQSSLGPWTAANISLAGIEFGGCSATDVSPVPTLQAWMYEVDWPVVAPVLHPGQHHRRPGAAMQRRSVASARGQF